MQFSNDQRNDKPGAPERMPYAWLRMYALVFEFLAYVGGFGYLGWWLDGRRGWQPWGLLAGLLIGTGIGLYRLVREGKRIGL